MAKTIYSIKTPDGNPVRAEEAWKDSDGNLLNKKVTTDTAQTITGAKTFSSQVIASGGVKTDKVTSTNGTEVLAYDGTTTALKGKATRPTYNGGDLALKSDVNAASDYHFFCQNEELPLLFNNVSFFYGKKLYVHNGKILTIANDIFAGCPADVVYIDSIGSSTKMQGTFARRGNPMPGAIGNVFDTSKVTSIYALFRQNVAITTIPAFDFSSVTLADAAFYNATGITSMLFTGMKVSFDIHWSTKMDQAALRVVIDNLADVSELGTSPTLTLGSTLLAKLTADDITTANNKGWNLA